MKKTITREVVLQHLILPKVDICAEESMYYRKVGVPKTDKILSFPISFKSHERLSFDTYFNSLSMQKWITYTNANENFYLKLRIKGKLLISLIHYYLNGDRSFAFKTLTQVTLESNEEKDFTLPYVTDNPFGCLTFVVEGVEPDSMLYGGAYCSTITKELNDVKLAIGICTFKREEYIAKNLKHITEQILQNKDCSAFNNVDVIVSDNGQTLDSSNFSNEHISIYTNKNTGGSGGFTRCIMEAMYFNDRQKKAEDKYTHVLLMDDDVNVDPNAIIRTHTMLSLLREEYKGSFVGGAMLKMDRRFMQHASGEKWQPGRPQNFIDTYNSNRDLRDLLQILENEIITDANYQAWWYCAFPIDICTPDNMPLPLFIKSDDIEFSARNMKNLILLNGINVWHESFETKYSAQNEYYTVRNFLIASTTRNLPIKEHELLSLIDTYVKHYVCNFKYVEIHYLCNAILDFLKGVDYFKSIDAEKLHKTKLTKGYKMVDVNTLPVSVTKDRYFADIAPKKQWTYLTKKLSKLTINGLLLPAKDYAILGMWGGTYEQTFRKKFLVRYEIETNKGFILERNLLDFVKQYCLYKKTRKQIKNKFNKVTKEFMARRNELITLALWEEKLN